jgi:hypothetical protein
MIVQQNKGHATAGGGCCKKRVALPANIFYIKTKKCTSCTVLIEGETHFLKHVFHLSKQLLKKLILFRIGLTNFLLEE